MTDQDFNAGVGLDLQDTFDTCFGGEDLNGQDIEDFLITVFGIAQKFREDIMVQPLNKAMKTPGILGVMVQTPGFRAYVTVSTVVQRRK